MPAKIDFLIKNGNSNSFFYLYFLEAQKYVFHSYLQLLNRTNFKKSSKPVFIPKKAGGLAPFLGASPPAKAVT